VAARRLIAINKIEEFAILSGQIIEPQIKNDLEKLNFIERIPLGIFHFRFLKNIPGDFPEEKTGEILVYDNVYQAYMNFVDKLPRLFKKYDLNEKDFLTDEDLDYYAAEVEKKFCSYSGTLCDLSVKKTTTKTHFVKSL
jgi:hypothetical protein